MKTSPPPSLAITMLRETIEDRRLPASDLLDRTVRIMFALVARMPDDCTPAEASKTAGFSPKIAKATLENFTTAYVTVSEPESPRPGRHTKAYTATEPLLHAAISYNTLTAAVIGNETGATKESVYGRLIGALATRQKLQPPLTLSEVMDYTKQLDPRHPQLIIHEGLSDVAAAYHLTDKLPDAIISLVKDDATPQSIDEYLAWPQAPLRQPGSSPHPSENPA